VPEHHKVVKAVIPAAGLGTRMLPATKAIPKEMLPVAGKPLIQYAVEEAAASGIQTVILVVRSKKSPIQAHFSCHPELEFFLQNRRLADSAEIVRGLTQLADLQFVEQEKPLGLAHAISCAHSLIGEEPFVVLLPDVIITCAEPATLQLLRAHQDYAGSVVAIREVAQQDVKRHGIVLIERSSRPPTCEPNRVTRLVEKPSPGTVPSRLGIFGRYLLKPAIWETIALTKPDSRGEVQLTDALDLLCRKDLLFGLCFEGHHYDAGDPTGYLKANIELSLRDPQLRPSLLRYLSQLQSELGLFLENISS
jgi:UTP--glucose-1-phosphate uridylyltransferase